jgi:hypothetical protein
MSFYELKNKINFIQSRLHSTIDSNRFYNAIRNLPSPRERREYINKTLKLIIIRDKEFKRDLNNLFLKSHGNNLHLRPLSPLRNNKKPSPKKRPKTRSQKKK